MMKKILITLIVLIAFLIPLSVQAEPVNTWIATGKLLDVNAELTDSQDFYEVEFTIKTSQGIESYSALCPLTLVNTDIMFTETPALYHIKMHYENEWMIDTFKLLKEYAETYSMPSGIFYDYNAVGKEPAVTVTFGQVNVAPIYIQADAVKVIESEITITDVSQRLTDQTQRLLEDWTPITELIQKDGGSWNQWIPSPESHSRWEDYDGQTYYVRVPLFFAMHVFSLEPMRFTTIFSTQPIPEDWWK